MDTKEWEESPTYSEFFRALKHYLVKRFQENEVINSIPITQYISNISLVDVFFVILSSILWTYLRKILTDIYFKPLGHHYGLTPSSQSKMPESAWKFLYFLITWIINLYMIVLSDEYRFLQKPSSVWTGYSPDAPIPNKMYVFYICEFGFYFHFLYGTLFMDEWRKDYVAMIAHHIATIVLIALSFMLRCHNIGCLAMLTHDICDVFLELSKLTIYFKVQNGKVIKTIELASNILFFCFTLVWFIGRLYCFPLRVLYTVISDINGLQSVLPCSLLLNGFLWILQIINIYWSCLILKILYRVASGQPADDVREQNEKLNEKHRKAF